MPRASEAFGVREKLTSYCLNWDHPIGGPKATSFLKILGISLDDAEYLAGALQVGVRETAVTAVRDNAPFGVLCEVRLPVRGLRERHDRVAAVTTSWELRGEGNPPRLVTAYISG
jgi:filamentous hemagglutinin